MATSKTVNEILDAASKGYPEELVSAAYDGFHSDTLADFIVLEIKDVCEGSDDPWSEAVHALERAVSELNSVIAALIKFAPADANKA